MDKSSSKTVSHYRSSGEPVSIHRKLSILAHLRIGNVKLNVVNFYSVAIYKVLCTRLYEWGTQ